MFSKITLGTDHLASLKGGISDDACRELFAVGKELGVEWLDTADSYASGDSERFIGRLGGGFKVVTKVGYRYGALPGAMRLLNQVIKKMLHTLGARQCFSPRYVALSIRRSLARLQRQKLDLILLHNPPASALSSELRDALMEAQKTGQISGFGLSSPDASTLRLAMDWAGVAALQTVVNETTISPLKSALEMAMSRNIPVMAHGVYAGGNRSDALRFALAQPGVVTVLSGTRTPRHLRENVMAVEA